MIEKNLQQTHGYWSFNLSISKYIKEQQLLIYLYIFILTKTFQNLQDFQTLYYCYLPFYIHFHLSLDLSIKKSVYSFFQFLLWFHQLFHMLRQAIIPNNWFPDKSLYQKMLYWDLLRGLQKILFDLLYYAYKPFYEFKLSLIQKRRLTKVWVSFHNGQISYLVLFLWLSLRFYQ